METRERFPEQRDAVFTGMKKHSPASVYKVAKCQSAQSVQSVQTEPNSLLPMGLYTLYGLCGMYTYYTMYFVRGSTHNLSGGSVPLEITA